MTEQMFWYYVRIVIDPACDRDFRRGHLDGLAWWLRN
jgi:hypothetical protein